MSRRLLALLLLTGCMVQVEARSPAPTMVSEPNPTRRSAVKEHPSRWWLAQERVFERGDGWTLPLVLDLAGQAPPDHPVRYRVDLALQVAYERVDSETDGPSLLRAVPVEGEHRVAIEEQVCFRSSPSDSGRYQVAVRLERSVGFQPGEYEVTLRGPNGVRVGKAQRITLH